MVERVPALLLGVPLEQRPVDDPDQAVLPGRDQVEALGELDPQLPEDGVGDAAAIGDDQEQVPLLGAEPLVEIAQLGLGEELGGRRAPPVPLPERPDQALRPQLLGAGDQAVELGARQLAAAGVQPPHRAARLDDRAEDLELGLGEGVGEVGELEPEPQVRPVGAEPGHRLVVGKPLDRELERGPAGPLEDVGDQPLVDLEHVVDVDERHLDVELGEVGLAVGAEVLVAEAAGDLVVALEPGDHQQLLEELRRLRQRVEGAALEPAGDEEVAGALRGRAGQDRSLDVEKALGVEELAHRRGHPVAERERLAHRLAAEVEVAVAEAGVLTDLAGEALDLERRRVGVGEPLRARRPGARTHRSAGRD